MLRRLIGPLPEWAQTDHPLLRYALQPYRPDMSRGARVGRVLLAVVVLSVLIVCGYFVATDGLQQAQPGINIAESLWRIAYWPAFIVQIVIMVLAFSLGLGVVDAERRRQTWDKLRATERGAEMALRTRWLAVFYRLRNLFVLLIGVRVLLVLGVLYQLTSHRGAYLDLLTANLIPAISLPVGVVLLAALLTAAFLLPLTSVGVVIALGLWVSVTVRGRAYAGIIQVIWIGMHVLVVVALTLAMSRFAAGALPVPELLALLLTGIHAALGDWGLYLMSLSQAGEIWAIVPYSVLLGPILLIVVGLQAALADGLLALAVRQAQRSE